jgi:hypothetical protein
MRTLGNTREARYNLGVMPREGGASSTHRSADGTPVLKLMPGLLDHPPARMMTATKTERSRYIPPGDCPGVGGGVGGL